MDNFTWQHIEFDNGSNPYICKTEKEFKRIERKYNLIKIKDGLWHTFWLAKERNSLPIINLFDFSLLEKE